MKKKLLSVFLAALIGLSCVTAGVVLSGKATAVSAVPTPTVIYTVGDYTEEGAQHFSSISGALQKADEKNHLWESDDVVEIRFRGDAMGAGAQNGVLFRQSTIWREDGTKLPITIRGIDRNEPRDSNIYLDSAGGWYACANDYTFVNMTLPIANQETFFYAGSGNIRFEECNLLLGGSSRIVIHNVEEQAEDYLLMHDLATEMCSTYNLDVIPAGSAWQIARQTEEFGDKLGAMASTGTDWGDWNHDGDVGGGQYLNACIMFEVLTKKSCIGNTWRPVYSLKYPEMTFEQLQQIAHQAVTEAYGAGYYNNSYSADLNGDGVVNALIIGSSNAYYFPDELHAIAYAAGVNLRVVHAYYSGVPIKDIWEYINTDSASFSTGEYYDGGVGATKTSWSEKKMSQIISKLNWDSITTFQTAGKVDDYGVDPANHAANLSSVLADCAHAADIFSYLRSASPNARYTWYETTSPPVGAFGSTARLNGYIFGDTCTDEVFAGWPALQPGEKIHTSVTIGNNVQYVDPSAKLSTDTIQPKNIIRIAASGYLFEQTDTALTDEAASQVRFIASGRGDVPDIRPIDVEPTLCIDGGAVYNIATKLGGSPCNATVHVKSGAANTVSGENQTSQSGDLDGTGEHFYGDMNIRVTGGTIVNVYATWDAHVRGNMSIEIDNSDGNTIVTGTVRGLFGAGTNPGSCTGNVTSTIRNVNIGGSFHGGGGSGAVTNTLENCQITNTFIGARCGSPSSITNTLTGVSAGAETTSYMGSYGTAVNGNITNRLENCTFRGSYYGGNRSGNITGSITNTIIGGTYGNGSSYLTYGGSENSSTIGGAIINNLSGGATFLGNWFNGGNKSATFAQNNALPYRIQNTVDGCSFVRFGGGSTGASIRNTFSGAASSFTTGCYCGSNSNTILSVENHFSSPVTGPVFGGCNNGNTGSVTNYVEAGASLGNFYGGNNGGGNPTSVTNNFQGGSVTLVYAGGNNYSFTGTLQNNISGGHIATFYGGERAGTLANVVTTVSGGEVDLFNGASESGTVQGNVTNSVTGGEITAFYGIGTGTVQGTVANTVSGGEINTFYGAGTGGTMGSSTTPLTVQNTLQGSGSIRNFYGGNNEGAFYGDISNTISGGAIPGLIYGGSYNGDITGTITNHVTGGVLNIFYGSLRLGTISGAVQNTVSGGRFTNDFIAGNGGSSSSGAGGLVTYVPAGSGAVFEKDFYGGTNAGTASSASTVIVGGTFHGNAVPGCKSTSSGVANPTLEIRLQNGRSVTFYKNTTATSLQGEGGTIRIGTNSTVSLTGSVTGSFTLDQTGNWSQGKTYLSGPMTASQVNVVTSGTGSFRKTVSDGVLTVVGRGDGVAPVAANLVLDNRVGVKFYFAKEDVTEGFTYQVTLAGNAVPIASGTGREMEEVGDYKVLFFTGIGLEDFLTEFTLSGSTINDPDASYYNTILKLAELGVASSNPGTTAERLFQSIADLGRVAHGDAAVYGLTYTDLVPNSSGQGPEAGASVTFTGKNLLMEGTLGLRLYGRAVSQEAIDEITVLVDGEDVTSHAALSQGVYDAGSGKYSFTLDLYLCVKEMDEEMTVLVRDGAGRRCLSLTDRMDWIAKTIVTREPTNDLAKQVLIYIQAVNAFVKQENVVIPAPEAGSETPVGDTVSLFG